MTEATIGPRQDQPNFTMMPGITKGRVTIWEDECRCFRSCDNTCDGLYNPWKDECSLSCFEQLREQEMLGDFPGGLKDLDTRRTMYAKL